MSLRSYLFKRVTIAVVLFFAVLVFNFFIFRLPIFVLGRDPMTLYTDPQMETEVIERLRVIYGIPERGAGFWPWLDHFIKYMQNMLTLNFGQSFTSFRPVTAEITERLPNTLLLMGTSTILAIIIGVVAGIWAASRHGGKLDTGLITVGLSLYSFPVFWLGMMFLLFFSYMLPIFPLGHTMSSPEIVRNMNLLERFFDLIWHLTLPVVTLTLAFFGGYMLLMRNTLVDVLNEDYILTAKAKGLPERTVLYKHAVRNAFLPLVTVIAISFAYIVSGAILTETVFSWFGMGRLLFTSLIENDWPVSQALFWLISITVIVANIFADLLYGILDPRIKYL
ncbi:MAG: ABC transporter permease [Candidatus Hodarchaeales archaeon]|jgi:peptide/nickel transport system permease protein